jgi:hypothetical protein
MLTSCRERRLILVSSVKKPQPGARIDRAKYKIIPMDNLKNLNEFGSTTWGEFALVILGWSAISFGKSFGYGRHLR